jgi:transcriptional regulator with XRE-family HTH domain
VRKNAARRFQECIRQLRLEHGWTQEHAAEKCGIGYKLYQLYELGIKQNPGLLTLEKIAYGFDLEIHELFLPSKPSKKSRH